MKNRFLVMMAAVAIAGASTTGCATRRYVRNRTDPLSQQTAELDKRTSENAQKIGALDEKMTREISRVEDVIPARRQKSTCSAWRIDPTADEKPGRYGMNVYLLGKMKEISWSRPEFPMNCGRCANRRRFRCGSHRDLHELDRKRTRPEGSVSGVASDLAGI